MLRACRKNVRESETWKIPVRWSGKRSLAFPAGSMAGNGPEGRVVDRKGVWWTGRASRGQEMNRRGIIGLESVAAASGQLGNSWNAKSAKRGLSACSVEGPLTTKIFCCCASVDRSAIFHYRHDAVFVK